MIDFIYQSGNTVIHRLNPSIKISGLLLLSILILNLDWILCLLLSSLLITVLIHLAELDLKVVFSPIKRVSWFLILIFLFNAILFNNGNCFFKKWLICISYSGIIQGLNIILHTISITLLSTIFICTTTSIEIMKGLESLMKPLKTIGFPTRDIALIISVSLQFIPIIFFDFDRIKKSQIARGANISGKSIKDRVKYIYPIVIPAFTSAFRRADELALAIEARGYRSEKE